MKTSRLLVTGAALGAVLFGGLPHSFAAQRTPLQIEQTVEPRFPNGLLLSAITTGEAWVIMTVDATGKLTDALPTRYTHEAFATEVLRVLRQWKYEPAKLDGEPIAVRIELQFSFRASGAIVSLDSSSTLRALLPFAEHPRFINRLCPPTELDRTPEPVRRVSPRQPASVAQKPSVEETAVLDFIIDEKGLPRMPVLVNSPGAEFANQAAAALEQWQFSPPTRRGVPVSVRVQQAFVFPSGS